MTEVARSRAARMRFGLLVICVWIWGAAGAREALPPRAGIATAHPLATQAGEQILGAGGNAFDAAVAVSAALAVVEPYASGLGGGAFWLLHEAATQRDVFVDAREVAPAGVTPSTYLDSDGQPRKGATLNGALAAGIPGQPAGLVHLAARYGRLPLGQSLAPAIRLAEQGFEVGPALTLGLRFRARAAADSPAFMAVFYPGGQALEPGALLRQPDLASTLRRFAEGGVDGYYRGETARMLVDGVRAAGGLWSLEDLERYRVVEREPLRAEYRGVRLTLAPPPSSGGVAITNMLNILAGFELAALPGDARKHLVIESMRRAYRDRALYLGDPDFAPVPVARLTSPDYAAGQRTSIRIDRATPSADLPGLWPEGPRGRDTTHFSILDREGNRVAGTMSINTWYGSAFMAPGTGVILNNEMDDFAVSPGVPNDFQLLGSDANAVAPGKRMLSSMSPTFLESDRGVAIVGTPGGSRIITMVLLATLAWIDGASAEEMVGLKRYHHQYYPDTVAYEAGAFTPEEEAALQARGHRLVPSQRTYGNMNVVTWDFGSGRVDTATDPRGRGEGATIY